MQLDRRDLKELLAPKVQRDLREQLAPKVPQVPRVLLDLRVHRDPLEPKVPQALRVRLALKELRVPRVLLVPKELQAHREALAHKAHKVLQGQMGQTEHKGQLALQVRLLVLLTKLFIKMVQTQPRAVQTLHLMGQH